MQNRFLILLFLLSNFFVHAQDAEVPEYNFTLYSQKDGLAFNQVNCSYRDSYGFLWVGTRNGLSCFDGYRFENYFHDFADPNSLGANDISYIDEDIEGNIWVATWGGGVSVFDRKTKSFTNYNSKSKLHKLEGDDVVRLLHCDSKGRVWVGTNTSGLVMIYPKKNIIKTVSTRGEKSYCSLMVLKDDVLLVGNWRNVTTYQIVEDELHYVHHKEVEHPKALLKLNENRVWIGGNEGMFDFTNHEQQLIKLKSLNDVGGIVKLGKNVLIGTKNGIAHMHATTLELTWIDQLANVRHAFHDKKDNIFWFSTKSGLLRCEKRAGKISEHFTERKFTDVQALSDTKFLGVSNQDVLSFDLQGKESILFHATKTPKTELIKITDRVFIIDQKRKLSIIDLKKRKKTDTKFPYFINYTYYSPITKHLFVFQRFRIKEYELDTVSLKMKLLKEHDLMDKFKPNGELQIRKIEEDEQGYFWVAMYGGGLLRMSLKDQSIRQVVGEENRFIEQMNYDKVRKKIWLTSRQGLMTLDVSNEKFSKDYAIKNRWLTFIERDDNFLWLGSYKGILRYDIANSNYVLISEKAVDGKVLSHKSFMTTKRIFTILQDDGFVSLDRKPSRVKYTSDSVYISSFAVGDSIYKNIQEDIVLSHEDNELTISFSCVGFRNQNEHVFQMRMLGINNEWKKVISGNSRNIHYADLSPGEHVFQVRLNTNNRRNLCEVKFEILPPFWRTTTAYLLYIVSILGALVLAYYLVKRTEARKTKIKEELFRIDEEKKYSNLRWRLFTDISHEIKTPLTLILSPLEEFLKGGENKQLDVSTAQLVHRNAERLEELVKQLLDFRKVESNMLKLHVKEEDIIASLRLLKESFQSLANQYEFDFTFLSDHNTYLGFFDKDILERIIVNLLSNAFKYTPPKGTVSLEAVIDKKKNNAIISIKDSGIGMDEQTQSKVFQRFQSKGEVQTDGFSSTGLGLSLVKGLVQLHHANIKIDSEVAKGSTFVLTLPLAKDFYVAQKEAVMELQEENTVKDIDSLAESTEKEAKQYTILLAEDNFDIHHYLKNELEKDYTVHAYMNGKEAWENIQDVMPDLVLSDIMMPEMTGIELCQKIKQEEKTSHIPILLLTAKGSHDNKVEGLESGADDYIKKPFRLEEVKARIKNVIQIRQSLQAKYSNELLLEGNVLKSNSLDEQFIQKAMTVVEKFIEDPEFNNKMFCKEMGYGKTQLYTKLKALTNMSPNEFVRLIRLRKAAALIKQKNVNVSEVAYMVGYSSRSYFSTSFKEVYGVSPKEYQNGEGAPKGEHS